MAKIKNKKENESVVHCRFHEMVLLQKLKANPMNPNKHPKDQIEDLAREMKVNGIRKPIVVSKQSKKIVTGHGELQAIKLNKWSHAPVEYQDFSSPGKEWAHMIADNALSRRSTLDMGMINQDLVQFGPDDLDPLDLGIKDFEIDVADKKEKKNPKEEHSAKTKCPKCGHKFTI